MKTFKLTYRENNETSVLGEFQHQEELNRLIESEARTIESESAMPVFNQMVLIDSLKQWASSQWNPNAAKRMTYKNPDSETVGVWEIEEVRAVEPIRVTFTYAPDLELGAKPEDVSVHSNLTFESAKNLVAFNMDNKGLVSINIEYGVED